MISHLQRHLKLGCFALLSAFCVPACVLAAPQSDPGTSVSTFHDMLTQGSVSGTFRMLYFAGNNAFYAAPHMALNASAAGGRINYTTATFNGFSARLGVAAQRNISRSRIPADVYLAHDQASVAAAWLQWKGDHVRVRAGNQKLRNAVPFTGTYDFRIVSQVYQGLSVRYGGRSNYIMAVRMWRYRSRLSNAYTRKTNYNSDFDPFSPVTRETPGFWGLGAAGKRSAGAMSLSGKVWYLRYLDYANLLYTQGKVAAGHGTIQPFVSVQYAHETGRGEQLLGRVDSQLYGVKAGVSHNSFTAALGYDRMPHHAGAYLYGALVTPYAHNEASGPIFAQPLMNSTQDLGSGNAYELSVSGSPLPGLSMKARYTYMDLKPMPGAQSIEQSGYMFFLSYKLHGWLKHWTIEDYVIYQRRPHEALDHDWFSNRLHMIYTF